MRTSIGIRCNDFDVSNLALRAHLGQPGQLITALDRLHSANVGDTQVGNYGFVAHEGDLSLLNRVLGLSGFRLIALGQARGDYIASPGSSPQASRKQQATEMLGVEL